MPAVSQAQRGYLASKFGPEWMKKHHFDNKGKLPKHVKSTDPKVHRKMREARVSGYLKKAFSK
jgi:hypothetical protein